MSVITKFLFDNPSDFTLVNTQVSGGVGSLLLQDLAALTFTQNFDSSTGFTFDAGKTEFISGVMRQIDLRPPNASFHANFNTNEDGNWGNGTLTGTLVNGAIVANGKLDLTGGAAAKHSAYSASGNADHISKMAIRFDFIPNYTGSPSSTTQTAFIIRKDDLGGNENLLGFNHMVTSGQFRLNLFNNIGNVNNIDFGVFSATSGVKVEVEINIDLTPSSEAIRLFIDGVQFGATSTIAVTRDSNINIFKIGGTANTEFKIDNFIVFSEVQHTANYTPGIVIPAIIFASDTIDLPNFLYTTVGAVQSLNLLAVTEVGTVRYTFEGKYFDGADWVNSDGSFAQANTLADVNTNIGTLVVIGETTISVQVVTTDSNTLASVEDLILTYTGQEYPSEGSLLTLATFIAKDLLGAGFIEEVTTPTNTAIKYAIDVNGQDKWFNGSAWVNSDGTFLEANTELEMQTNLDTLLSISSIIKIKIILQTTDTQITPDILSLTVQFDFGAIDPGAPLQCQVFGYIKDIEGLPVSGAVVSFVPDRVSKEYREATSSIIAKTVSRTTDTNGFFSINLIRSSEFETDVSNPMKYIVTIDLPNEDIDFLEIGRDAIKITVPDLVEVNITNQLTAK